MIITRPQILLLAAATVLPGTLVAADHIQADVLRCGAIVDNAARLECFDALTEQFDETRSAESLDATQTSESADHGVESETVPLDDSVGKEQVETTDTDAAPTYVARLTRCEEIGPSRLAVFYLDNGQVWKQRNSGGRRMRNCDADIEISRDMFGFKLRITSQKRTIRVSRVR